jgi:hypothetical protein
MDGDLIIDSVIVKPLRDAIEEEEALREWHALSREEQDKFCRDNGFATITEQEEYWKKKEVKNE